MRTFLRRASLLALLVLASACARAIEVNSEPSTVYAIEVVNTRSTDMVVSYDDGNGVRSLGTVRAGATERFVIAAPPAPRIEVSARSTGGATVGPIPVSLTLGQTTTVRL